MKAKSRYIIPNFFTGMNFLLGVFSALLAATYFSVPKEDIPRIFGGAPIILAAWMIIWGALLDKLDGIAAKVMNASSGFGAQFDSLADLIAFGIAPAFLSFFFLRQQLPEWSDKHIPLLLISVSVYVLAAAMRLARYNVKDGDELGNYFLGFPSTFSGGMVAVFVILTEKYNLFELHPSFKLALPLLLIVLGILMLSPFYLPKLVKRKNPYVNYLQGGTIIIGYICGLGKQLPEVLLIMLSFYAIYGFAYCFFKKEDIQFAITKSHED